MRQENVYLKPNVIVEPLISQWHAWPYLIPPPSAAMYIANSHLKIMQSFVSAPQIHVAALKNPAMMGGPFLNCDPARVNEIKQLVTKTSKEQADLVEFATAIKTLEETLAKDAKGFSLEQCYRQIPEPLMGYVELVYDVNNNPTIRFIEGLLYRSKYYRRTSQSVALEERNCDGRPFVFSTPRLKEDGRLHLDIPFDSPVLDELLDSRFTAKSYDHLRELLGVPADQDRLLSSFFWNQQPHPPDVFTEDGVRIRYMGHACVLIQTKSVSILTDPMVSYDYEGGIKR